LRVSPLYKGELKVVGYDEDCNIKVEKKLNFYFTDKLQVIILSPKPNQEYIENDLSEIKLKIRYADGEDYDKNVIYISVNGKKVKFEKRSGKDGPYWVGHYQVIAGGETLKLEFKSYLTNFSTQVKIKVKNSKGIKGIKENTKVVFPSLVKTITFMLIFLISLVLIGLWVYAILHFRIVSKLNLPTARKIKLVEKFKSLKEKYSKEEIEEMLRKKNYSEKEIETIIKEIYK
jgi:hypothetical protein